MTVLIGLCNQNSYFDIINAQGCSC